MFKKLKQWGAQRRKRRDTMRMFRKIVRYDQQFILMHVQKIDWGTMPNPHNPEETIKIMNPTVVIHQHNIDDMKIGLGIMESSLQWFKHVAGPEDENLSGTGIMKN